jgi:O-antigen/teichoic acid export membrane protein
MRIRNRLINGTTFNLIAVAFNQGSTLIANISIARILLDQGFGKFAMVQGTLLTLSSLSQIATGYTASKYISEFRTSDPQKAGRIVAVCEIVSAVSAGLGMSVFIIIAPWLANSVLKDPTLTTALMVGAGYIFFSAINGYQTGALSGLEAYKSMAKAGLVSGIGAVAAIYLGAFWGGVNGAIIGLSLSSFIRWYVHKVWLRIEVKLNNIVPVYSGSFRQEKSLVLSFAFPAILAGYFSQPLIWLGSYFLMRQPEGSQEMAYYSAAFNIRTLLLFMPFTVNGVISSILNHLRGCGNEKIYALLFKYNAVFVLVSTSALALLLATFSDFVLRLFGKNFTEGKTVLLILLASGVLEASAGSLYHRIQNAGKLWLSFVSLNLPLSPMFVIVAYFLVPRQGAIGLGIANIIMTSFTLFIVAILAYHISRHENLKDNKSQFV